MHSKSVFNHSFQFNAFQKSKYERFTLQCMQLLVHFSNSFSVETTHLLDILFFKNIKKGADTIQLLYSSYPALHFSHNSE